jgi:hypothetical protein
MSSSVCMNLGSLDTTVSGDINISSGVEIKC